MLCYKDMTFCNFYKDCKGASECGRPLTKQIQLESVKTKRYICQFADKPNCWIKKGDR